ncbi:hypothetical protein B296_00016966 [Ensete ventricosum]|uniref:Uncharacterized protein n=1 Tax=Ensete ventricosum TaxID=4639 RepID=A0A426Z3C2_ENSVE|nr:hypothetical protein B296_00016966 [Ensete ventricosum]
MLKQASSAPTESAAAADSGEPHPPDSDPSSAMPLPPSDGGTAAPVLLLPIVPLVRLMGAAAASLVVTWVVRFRGGLSLNSDNKDLIFNVTPSFCPYAYLFHLLLPNRALIARDVSSRRLVLPRTNLRFFLVLARVVVTCRALYAEQLVSQNGKRTCSVSEDKEQLL